MWARWCTEASWGLREGAVRKGGARLGTTAHGDGRDTWTASSAHDCKGDAKEGQQSVKGIVSWDWKAREAGTRQETKVTNSREKCKLEFRTFGSYAQ